MLYWNRFSPDEKIQTAMEMEVKQDWTVKQAFEKFKEVCPDKQRRYDTSYYYSSSKKSGLNVNKQLNQLVMKDVKPDFRHAKDLVQRLIRFAASGETAASPRYQQNGNEDIGNLTFNKAKTENILNLIPISGVTGRFAKIKMEVHEYISTLPKDESAVIQAPKRSMDVKEASAITKTVNLMLRRAKKPWQLLYNPLRFVFLLIRESDLNSSPKEKK